ncbi:SDR family NAD(P)-dependent oxidoreductase [Flavobacterium succinicans]|uniref:3-oxoacyl-[acyl-carrier-protein] reductase FabG n=1 Tax=Flavobacterium succinicans TaxID=29536 RepID=A0A199XNW8_9FLAO|nr:SDR family oxidoreductase [Flavobacterium succinicans]OAZ03107.1 3-oxoacyl-[acyl-carrier-protein] reductase FabG [Flavobacterium succinicans]
MNNIVFITGASSDIGEALIKNLTEECVIIAHYNSNNKRLLELQKEIKNTIVPIQADFSSNESIIEMLDIIESEIGVPNKIIHLAAPKFENLRFKDVDWNNFQNEINVSLGSITLILNRFLPKMALQKRGRVVTILSSVVLGVPPKAVTQYTTVKYALLGLMRALASEYADKKITVNCISPSMVETQFLSQINERIVELAAEGHPLKRNATVFDVIPSIIMLMSDDSAYINGVNIPITGGSNF